MKESPCWLMIRVIGTEQERFLGNSDEALAPHAAYHFLDPLPFVR